MKTTKAEKTPKKQKIEISQMDAYLFGNGRNYEIYKKLGAHPSCEDGKDGYFFAVWAPNAKYVSLVGDINEWRPDANPMTRMEDIGIWTCFIPDMEENSLYKYYIVSEKESIGWVLLHLFPNRNAL